MSRSKLVVLLIEHDEAVRVTHETILRTEGYEILSASDGLRALEQLREQAPDLVIVGHKIGSITPAQLIRMVKTDATLSFVPILACVAHAEEVKKDDLMRAGANAAMASDAPSQALMREVVSLIGRS